MLLYYIYIIAMVISLYYLFSSTFPDEIEKQVSETREKVSIIVPARNEEENIARCLESLMELQYNNTEIIVVDGDSDDDTYDIATSYERVSVIKEPDRPEGWVGKPWACYTGYKHARGDILLFTDADTYHSPSSLDTTLTELNKSEGFLSFLTTQEFGSFWEHMLSIVFLMISVSVKGTKGTDKAHIANGQYMMFTRERYEQLGTHKVVSYSIIEDLAFATHAAKQGIPPVIVRHRNLVTARMYRSLAEIKEGFGKNLGLGVNQTGVGSIISAGFITVWGLGWAILVVVELLDTTVLLKAELVIILLGYISFVLLLFSIEWQLSTKATFYVVIYPIYFVVFEFIVLWSLLQTFIRKEVIWKDRLYKI